MIEMPPKAVMWHDLSAISWRGTLTEMLHPLPWLILSIWLYASPAFWLAPPVSFMFFLCALRLNHEAIHSNLGLSRTWDSVILTTLSVLMLGSNHSVAIGHLKHHKNTLGPEDFEGKCGDMSLCQVLFYGPKFPIDLLRHAWRTGNWRWRRRIMADLIAIAMFLAFVAWADVAALWWHVGAMALAQCMTAFFAVWITHQGSRDAGIVARSQRGPLAWLAYMMFYHREHHLFPKVPVSQLPRLARRLDQTVPGYAASHRPVVPFLEPRKT